MLDAGLTVTPKHRPVLGSRSVTYQVNEESGVNHLTQTVGSAVFSVLPMGGI